MHDVFLVNMQFAFKAHPSQIITYFHISLGICIACNLISYNSLTKLQKSSMVYQVLLILNGYYFAAFVAAELLIFFYKWSVFPYPSGNIAAETVLLLFLCIIEAGRNFFGRKGNLTEHYLGIIISIVLTVPSVFVVLYYLLWQTYVLKLEVILTSIQLTFESCQSILALFCIINFSR